MEKNDDILNELKEISPLVAGIGRLIFFAVPQGYFESVADTVMASIKNEMPADADVPAGYFDTLSNNILSKIEGTAVNELQKISPLLAGIKKVNPFEVPVNYFEQVPPDVISQVEEDNIPALLEGVNKMQPFEVPAGYFEQLANTVLNKVKEESGARVITMPRHRNAILKYAAAAVFAGAAVLGVYKYSGNRPDVVTTNKPETAVAVMDDKKFDETLNNLNEDDIVKYLEKNGSETDIATLTSGIDENSLPSREEYFTDEKVLDNFLEAVNSKN